MRAGSESSIVEAREITKRYGTTVVLNSFSASFRHGEVVGLVGANGAGKSTAGRILAGALQK